MALELLEGVAGDSARTAGGGAFEGRRLGVGATPCFAFGILPFGDLDAGGEDECGSAGVDGVLGKGVDVGGAVGGPGVCAEVGAGDGVDAVTDPACKAGVGAFFFSGGCNGIWGRVTCWALAGCWEGCKFGDGCN